MKKIVRLNENDIRNIIEQILTEGLDDSAEVENVEAYNVLNDNFDGNWREVLTARLFNRNDECIGTLRDLHFKYDPKTNRFIGDRLV